MLAEMTGEGVEILHHPLREFCQKRHFCSKQLLRFISRIIITLPFPNAVVTCKMTKGDATER